MLRIHRERSLALAVRAIADLDLTRRVLVEGTQYGTTLLAVELDILKLREHAATPCYDARNAYQLVELSTSQIAKGDRQWDLRDADVDLGFDAKVVRIVDQDRVHRDIVEYLKHGGRRVREKVSQNGLAVCQVEIRDFE